MVSNSTGIQPNAEILIARMGERADLSQHQQLPRGPERRAAVYASLASTAERSQAPVIPTLQELQRTGALRGFESMALPNAILLDVAPGKAQVVRDALAGAAQIEGVTENRLFSDTAPDAESVRPDAVQQAVDGWSLTKIGADKAQRAGWDGTGITVGIADTGLDLRAAAVTHAYRGMNADGSMSHDYNWFDSFERVPVPRDTHGHGTSVAGFVVGRDKHRVTGVAPGAKIIATTVGDTAGNNTTAAALQGLQFLLAPTKVDGSEPDARRGADVVNLSWGNADLGDTSMRESIDGLRAAGIVVVAGAGNSGPRPNSMLVPAAYPGVISVGGTDGDDGIYYRSSRGDASDASKSRPTVAAPGYGVIGLGLDNRYRAMQGTSYASPHVAGAVASMLQAVPHATEDEILHALTSTATDVGEFGNDDVSGAGRINVDAAIEALQRTRTASA